MLLFWFRGLLLNLKKFQTVIKEFRKKSPGTGFRISHQPAPYLICVEMEECKQKEMGINTKVDIFDQGKNSYQSSFIRFS